MTADMTLILGIDTATNGCGAALVRDGALLARRQEHMARGQSEALMPMVRDILGEAGVEVRDLDAVAVTRGPGAFTGLRIGLAAARAFALAIGRPCLGIGTFEALAADAADALAADAADALAEDVDAVLIAIETKRDDLYVCVTDRTGTPLGEGRAAPPADVVDMCAPYARIAVAGDGAERALAALGRADAVPIMGCALPRPETVARLAARHLADPAGAPPTPLYLRPPDVTLPGGA